MLSIGKRFKKYFLLILIISLNSCGAGDNVKTDIFDDCFNNENRSSNYIIKKKKILVLRERCEGNSVSPCSDGYEQLYRLHPLFIKYKDSETLQGLYLNNEVYSISCLNLEEDFMKQNNMDVNWYDSLINIQSNTEVLKSIKYKSSFLKRTFTGYGKQSYFDGVFYYDLMELDIEYIYLGKLCIDVPNMTVDKKNRKRKITPVLVDYYCIIKIH